MTNERLFLKQMIMLNNFLNTGAMTEWDYGKKCRRAYRKDGIFIKRYNQRRKNCID